MNKKRMIAMALVLGGMSLQALSGAPPEVFEYEWDGSVPPEENDPPLGVNAREGEAKTKLNEDGTFSLSTDELEYSRSYINRIEWLGWGGGASTVVEIRARVDEQPPQKLRIATGMCKCSASSPRHLARSLSITVFICGMAALVLEGMDSVTKEKTTQWTPSGIFTCTGSYFPKSRLSSLSMTKSFPS